MPLEVGILFFFDMPHEQWEKTGLCKVLSN
jgi:hypothetical protein